MKSAYRLVLTLTLLTFFSRTSGAQTGFGGIPSGAQVAGATVGVAAVTVLVLYVALHKPSITGCVQSADGTISLMDKQNNLKYTLVNTNAEIKSGERVKISGKKKKDKDGHLSFRVKKVKKDYGPCEQ